MKFDTEKISENFLELSSEQRLKILFTLLEKKSNISSMAKALDATSPEVHRNFNRLVKSDLIKKESDGTYALTNYGKAICSQIPTLYFLYDNRKFFENHDFSGLPEKFIQRFGALDDKKHIKGFVKVLEQWKKIHKNAKKYIYNILTEVPYDQDIVDIIESKLKNKILIRSIFAVDAIVSDERKKIFEKKNFGQYVKSELLQRRMHNNVPLVVLLNEKESCVIFPKEDGTADMSEMFYSRSENFHEWCKDYFSEFWDNSSSFQEKKLAE